MIKSWRFIIGSLCVIAFSGLNLGRPRWIKLHQSKAWILPSQWDSRALSEKENPQSLTPNTNPWLTNQLFKIIFFAYDRTMVFMSHQSSIVIQPTFFLFASLFDWMGACKLNYLCILSEFCFLVGLRYAWSLVYFDEWHCFYSWELKLSHNSFTDGGSDSVELGLNWIYVFRLES